MLFKMKRNDEKSMKWGRIRYILPALMLLAALCLAGCGAPAETSTDTAQPSSNSGGSTEASETPVPTETAKPVADKEDLLSWGGKTLHGYGKGWGEHYYGSVNWESSQEEEEAEGAFLSITFGDDTREQRLLGNIVMGKDASLLFDIPAEDESEPEDESGQEDESESPETAEAPADPSVSLQLLEESVLDLMKTAQEDAALETRTINGTEWRVGLAKQSEFEGTAVLNVYAWTQGSDYLVNVNLSVVLRGGSASEDALNKAQALAEEWLAALEIK